MTAPSQPAAPAKGARTPDLRVMVDPRASSKMPLIVSDTQAAPYIHAKVCGGIGFGGREELADLIVRAVNSHAELVSLLQECSEYLHDFVPTAEGGSDEAVRLAKLCRAALSRALGER